MRASSRRLVDPEIGRVEFAPFKSLWLWSMLLPGVFLGIPALSWDKTLVSLALAFVTLCVGHSVGLHRGIIHRTYACSRLVRAGLAYLFVFSGLGGPLSWARLHAVRDYWQNRADCPPYFAYDHSLLRDFVWNLHMTFEASDDRALERLPADVHADPWLRFLEATWPLHVCLLALFFYRAGGAEWVYVCICARTAAGILGHWFVGYAAHAWGEQRYVVPGAVESGTNVWVLGVVSFGEGFHNNHHAFPDSARMGLDWREPDLGWLTVRTLGALGLIRDVRAAASPARIEKAVGSHRHGRGAPLNGSTSLRLASDRRGPSLH